MATLVKWTEADEARLADLFNAGLTWEQIAEEMPGRSHDAVEQRGRRLGLRQDIGCGKDYSLDDLIDTNRRYLSALETGGYTKGAGELHFAPCDLARAIANTRRLERGARNLRFSEYTSVAGLCAEVVI